MKLGINHRTGRNWTLTSWFSESIPTYGTFRLEWDPIGHHFILSRRGVTNWKSGKLIDGNAIVRFIQTDPYNYNYRFINVTNADEEYFTYTLVPAPEISTLKSRDYMPVWILDYMGRIKDQARQFLSFYKPSGLVELGFDDDNSSLSFSDCRDKCWKDCNCVGFMNHGYPGCLFYRGKSKFELDYRGAVVAKYVLISSSVPGKRKQCKGTER